MNHRGLALYLMSLYFVVILDRVHLRHIAATWGNVKDDHGERRSTSCPRKWYLQALHVLSFSRHVQLRSCAEADSVAHHQARLAQHAARTLALPVGRGALTLSTVHLLPTEPLTAHKFCLNGAGPRLTLLLHVVLVSCVRGTVGAGGG